MTIHGPVVNCHDNWRQCCRLSAVDQAALFEVRIITEGKLAALTCLRYKNRQMKRSGPPPRTGVRYEPPEKPPHLLSLGLALQLVMLNISGIVLIPKIIIEAAGAGEIYLSWAVFAGLCVCGLITIIQSIRIGRMGAGYILLMGTSGTFVAVSITALTEGGPALLATLIVVSSLFRFLLGSRLVLLRRVVTPLVAGTVIMLVAVTIMPIAFNMLARPPAGAPPAAAPASFGVTLVSMAGLALFATGAWRLWGPVLGVAATSVTHRQYHDTDVVMIRVDADTAA